MSSGDSLARLKRLPGKVGGELGSSRLQRLRAALIVGTLALLMALQSFLIMIDWLVWDVQAKMSPRDASGEIVFLSVDDNTADPDLPVKRVILGRVLDAVRRADAKSLYVDMIFDRPSTLAADSALRKAASSWGTDLHFVDKIDVALGGKREEFRSIDAVAGGNRKVWFGVTSEWPNVVYELPPVYKTSEGFRPSLSVHLAGLHTVRDSIQLDYGFSRRSIEQIEGVKLLDMSAAERARILNGKSVVVSTAKGATAVEFQNPTQFAAPPSFIAIYGAETLLAGGMNFVPGINATALVVLMLCLASVITNRRSRHGLYAALAIGLLIAVKVSGDNHVRIEFATAGSVLAMYAAIRLRARWRNRAALVDPDTGLPTLRALAADLASRRVPAAYVVMAKVHGYEKILKTLNARQRAAYLCKLSERVRVGDPRLAIYVDGHNLAWVVDEVDQSKLISHLEGLRAIFAAPVTIDAQTIDVGITFGAAPITEHNRERCIAAALAAVEETDEAIEPVRISDEVDPDKTMWDISLRSRIDAAMEAGEVFCEYQPKWDIGTDRILGVEALVRWEDPERGFISPLHFVMQCEKAGRMEFLTRYVLQSACSAGKLLHFRGYRISMAVNISATLLTDMRIVGIVRNVLQATDFDANHLFLEITETARIRDFATARTVLKALKALGTQLSMDDFGVGAANFEALQALPFDEIKIDRQFVSGAADNLKSRAITASIVELGTAARIAVVAEGAETPADLALLRSIGCWQVQGFALARPMNLTNLLSYMEANRKISGGG